MSLRVVSGELTLQDGGERGRARADAAGAVDVEGARLLRAAAVAHEDPAGRADDRVARAPVPLLRAVALVQAWLVRVRARVRLRVRLRVRVRVRLRVRLSVRVRGRVRLTVCRSISGESRCRHRCGCGVGRWRVGR